MTHDEVEDLLAVYAVGAVAGAERVAIEAHLETCERCSTQLRDLAGVAEVLGSPGRPLPDDLRNELVAAIQAAQSATANGVGATPGRRWRHLAVAAAVVVLVTGVGGIVFRQQQRIDELALALRDPVSQRVEEAASAPGSDSFELRSPDGGTAISAVITRAGEGYLEGSALAPLAAERTYQLWGIEGDRTVSLALLGSAPDVVQFDARIFMTFAITEEVAGGAVTPSLPALAQGLRPD